MKHFRINQFVYSPRSYVADASDLGLAPGVRPVDRLYNDACDEGLTLTDLTGQNTTWYLYEETKEEGGVYAWKLKPTSETLRMFPKLEHHEIVIFND